MSTLNFIANIISALRGRDELMGGINTDIAVRDAFGRVRASTTGVIAGHSFPDDADLARWGAVAAAGGSVAHDLASATVALAVPAAAGAKAVRQTLLYHPWSPGASRFALAAGTLREGGPAAGCVSRIGYFDDAADKAFGADAGFGDGAFFELDGSGLRAVVRSSVSGAQADSPIEQPGWNIDRLDGSGGSSNASGETLRPEARNAFVFDFDSMAGSVRFGAVLGGRIVYCHEEVFASGAGLPLPALRTLRLPLRYEISSAGAAGGTMRQIASAVGAEGGGGPASTGTVFSADIGAAVRNIPIGSPTPILVIRFLPGYARRSLTPIGGSLMLFGKETTLWQVKSGGAASGAGTTWAPVSAGASGMEFSINATGYSNGAKHLSGYLEENSREVLLPQLNAIIHGAGIDGTPNEVAVLMEPDIAAENVAASLFWRER